MDGLALVLIVAWLAGVAAFVGGAVASLDGGPETEGKRELLHGIIGFGGGILVAAVALALVPEAMAVLSPVTLALTFLLGGVVFSFLDAQISRRAGNKAQTMAMLMDFVPEAIALGALFGQSHKTGFLLAMFIGAQNLPEGFNAFRENVAANIRPRTTLWVLLGISLLGPAAAGAGYIFLNSHPTLTGCIMSFAGGGILYLVFQDIAPQSTLRRHWTPPLGAVLGFAVGMIGNDILG